MIDWEECEMETEKYAKLRSKVIEMKDRGWNVKGILAEIYHIYQDYLISEEQESELYSIADPEEKYNSPSEYWWDDYGCLPIWECTND